MARSTTYGLVAAAILVASGVAAALPASAALTAATFSAPLLLAGGGAEPSIRVPADGLSAAYVSAPNGIGSNFWRITERKNPNGSLSFVQSPVQQPDLGTGGGDSEISVGDRPTGQSPCDTIAYSGLHNIDLLDNFTVATSTDCGKTFSLANPYGTQNTLTDRQWQAFDGASTNFLIYHTLNVSQIVVSESRDGGQTYVSLDPDTLHGVIDAATLPAVANSNIAGNIIVDHSHLTGRNNVLSGEPVHRMYATFIGPASAADNVQGETGTAGQTGAQGAGYNHHDTVYLGRSDDGGITWTDTKVFGVNPLSNRELNLLFPVAGIDSVGNVYVAWSDGFKVQYAASTDGGKTFGNAHQVNHDNLGLVPLTGAEKPDPGKADLFPWIVAGAKGMLDVVWYHGEGGAPTSNLAHRDPGDKNTSWTVAFSQISNAAAKTPHELNYSQAITPIVHYGDICQNGTFCSLVPVPGAPFSSGDRSLLDFFQVAIDKAGRANIALADNAASPGSHVSGYIRQTSGYSLTTGKRLKPQTVEPPELVCSADAAFTDPAGDADEVAVAATPLPSAPGLDVLRGWVGFDAKRKLVNVHTRVLDLSKTPALGSSGSQYDFQFTYNKQSYSAVARRELGKADRFSMSQVIGGLNTSVGAPLKGSFDVKKSVVTVSIPADYFHKLNQSPVIGKGSSLTGLAAQTRRLEPALLAPVTDVAGSLGCPFVVGGAKPSPAIGHSSESAAPAAASGAEGQSALTVPARTDARKLPKAQSSLASRSAPLGFGLVGLGLVLGAASLRVRSRRA